MSHLYSALALASVIAVGSVGCVGCASGPAEAATGDSDFTCGAGQTSEACQTASPPETQNPPPPETQNPPPVTTRNPPPPETQDPPPETQNPPPYTPPTGTPWTCNATLLTDQELRQRIAAGASELALESIKFDGRYRDCFPGTGCSAWQTPSGNGFTNLTSGSYHSNNRTMNARIRTALDGSLSLVSISYNSPATEKSVPIHGGLATGTSGYIDHWWAHGYQSPFIEAAIEAEFAEGCVALRLAKESATLSNGGTREWEFGARIGLPAAN